ncbi:hypothetical protein L6452_13016 [Arctium lappa]|uniref:Uncharacterized protein n=1 Tax=Arctium lappa TaxID=4217 RepID=A0ACB9CHF1_ARCLA|nr:hypothetical protein L6452_13016 [Arctium lappa]
MGESMVEAQNMENKMGESVSSLGVSVSFGKYENDALSWEKWSTFSPNKYLEEVGKCSTPGSVAQKKAFFEAHYKKIAAMKAEAELLDQEKAAETDPSKSDDHTEYSFGEVKEELEDGTESKVHVFEEEEVEYDISAVEGSGEGQEEKPDSNRSHCPEEATSFKDECFQDGSGKHQDEKPDSVQSHCPEEATFVKDECFQDGSGKRQGEKPDSDRSHCPEEATFVEDERFQDGSGNHQDEKPESDQSHCPEETTEVNNESFLDGSMQMGNALESQHMLSSRSPIGLKSNADKLAEATLVNDESMKLVKQHFDVGSEIEEVQESMQEIPKPKAQNLAGNESMRLVKQDFHLDSEIEEIQESKQEIRKVKAQNLAGKVNPGKVEKNFAGMKKKPASPIPKLPETSVTRLSKPKATPTSMPGARSSSKKANAPSSSNSKTPSVSESTRVAPKSLHLSMSMSSVNSDTASSVTSSRRRSLFMEQMGDKDIVKRAFKTFQNRVNQLPSSDGRSSGSKQIRTTGSEQKASTSMTSQKENERSRKAAEKINPARGRLGPTWKSVSSGSLKGVGADERRQKAASSSVALRSNERAERRKEFFKKLEEKSNAREAERTQLGSKSKEEKDAEMKKIRQNLSFKAKPMPSFYRAQGVSKSTSEKEAVKTGTQRRPDSHR